MISYLWQNCKLDNSAQSYQQKTSQSCSPLVFLCITFSKALKILLPLVGELILSQVWRCGSSDGRVSVGERMWRIPCVVEDGRRVAWHHSTIHCWVLRLFFNLWFPCCVFCICLVTQNKYKTKTKWVSRVGQSTEEFGNAHNSQTPTHIFYFHLANLILWWVCE